MSVCLVTFSVVVAALNVRSVSGTGKVSVFFTAAKITALILIIIGGMVYLGQGKVIPGVLNGRGNIHITLTYVI